MRVRCSECCWTGDRSAVLEGLNPFDSTQVVEACPDCKEINRLEIACHVSDCPKLGEYGAPTPDGYVLSCHEHQPKEAKP